MQSGLHRRFKLFLPILKFQRLLLPGSDLNPKLSELYL
jgi:hypothetical protein